MSTADYFRERALANAIKRARYEDKTALQVTHWFSRAEKELTAMIKDATEKGADAARLRSLLCRQRELLEEVAFAEGRITAERLERLYEQTYYKNIFDAQQAVGIGGSFAMLDARGIYEATNTAWSGKHYSDRIWTNTKRLATQIDRIINTGFLNGYGIDRMSSDLKKAMASGAYEARRVIRTEMAYVAGQATKDSYEEYGVERYEFLATLDLRTSEICQSLDGKIFRTDEATPGVNYPPMHPHCRSTTIGHWEDFIKGSRAARDAEGNTYDVPGDMTYDEWYEKHVKGNTSDNEINGDFQTKYKKAMDAAGEIVKKAKADNPNNLFMSGKLGNFSDEDKKAIFDYMSAKSYILNDKLRRGIELDESEKNLMHGIDRAIMKLPEYEGTVYRSLSSRGIPDVNAFNLMHRPGEIVSYDAFTSAATKVYDDSMDIQMTIHSKHGCDLRDINRNEKEILFKRGSSFMVIKNKNGIIEMMEV